MSFKNQSCLSRKFVTPVQSLHMSWKSPLVAIAVNGNDDQTVLCSYAGIHLINSIC